jgi:lipopolysaccharide transport system ATP-binding protein
MQPAILVEDVSKSYKIGEFSSESLLSDLKKNVQKVKNVFNKANAVNQESHDSLLWSLKDISFTIEKGETFGIIGKNGAGKSTLLKILSQITSPTTGSVKLNGNIASLLEVGTGFHPDLTGRENIFLNGAILGMRKTEIQKNFDEIVEFAGVSRFIDTPVKRYSSGMYVRLAFAVAAHLNSDVLIVDEVLAVGDGEFQKKCLGKMNEVSHSSGKTILFVSHNLHAVRHLCKRSILLDKGRLVLDSTTSNVIAEYLNYSEAKSFEKNLIDKDYENNWFKLTNIRLKDAEDNTISVYNISEEYYIELAYSIKKESRLKLSLTISTDEGITVFSSLNNHETEFYEKFHEPGEYRSSIRIPGNFFNEGSFSISLASYVEYVDNFSFLNIITFNTSDDGVLKKDYFGGYGGFIRPQLKWESKKY